jgi:hypothetical protein
MDHLFYTIAIAHSDTRTRNNSTRSRVTTQHSEREKYTPTGTKTGVDVTPQNQKNSQQTYSEKLGT